MIFRCKQHEQIGFKKQQISLSKLRFQISLLSIFLLSIYSCTGDNPINADEFIDEVETPPSEYQGDNIKKLVFDYGSVESALILENFSGKEIEWEIKGLDKNLLTAQSKGTIKAGQSKQLNFIITGKEDLADGVYTSTFKVVYSNRRTYLYQVENYVGDNSFYELDFIGHKATYNAKNEKYYIKKSNTVLKEFDPISKVSKELYIPTANIFQLALGPDNDILYVKGFGTIVSVDLATFEITEDKTVYPYCEKLLCPSKDVLFVFESIKVLKIFNCKTDSCLLENNIVGGFGLPVKLSKDKTSFYSEASSQLIRYDIVNETNVVESKMIDWWAHEFWISDDGSKMLDSYGNIIDLSADPEEDLKISGNLNLYPDDSRSVYAADLKINDNLIAISTRTEIKLLDGNFNFIRNIALPRVGEYDWLRARFINFNADLNKIYVLFHNETQNNWLIKHYNL